MTNNNKTLLVFGVLSLFTLIFWRPTLMDGKSLIHGDLIVHGLPLFDFHSRFLHGGHPLFAEGQGGFANPLNILLAWLLPPIIGANIFHLVCMLTVFSLCPMPFSNEGRTYMNTERALSSNASLSISSSTFRYGLWLTLLSLFIAAGLLTRHFLARRR